MSSTFTFCCHLTDLYTRKKIRKCRVQSGMAACFKTGTLRYTCWLSATAYHSSGCCVFCACLHRRPLFYFIFFFNRNAHPLTVFSRFADGAIFCGLAVVFQIAACPSFPFRGWYPHLFYCGCAVPFPKHGSHFQRLFRPWQDSNPAPLAWSWMACYHSSGCPHAGSATLVSILQGLAVPFARYIAGQERVPL